MSYFSRFYQMKDLIKIYMVSFISAEFVVVKLKVFKFFLINSASMKWPLLGFFGTLVQRPEAVSNKTTQCFYLHYKTITSQNVSSEAQVKNFFIL